MPPNRAANVRRRLRQADGGLKRAQRYMADVYVTVAPQHPALGGALMSYLLHLDMQRQYHLQLYRTFWGGTERDLWKSGELGTILDEAELIKDPKGRT